MSYIEYVTTSNEFESSLDDLARANGFTYNDLVANRNGEISSAQWGRLVLQALQPIRYTGGALAGWLICCFVVSTLVPSIALMIAGLFGLKSIGVLFGAITFTCAIAFVVSIMKSGRSAALLIADLREGRAACIEGRVSPSREDEKGLGMARLYGQKHTNTWYAIKDEYFAVDEDAHIAIREGGQFRLYHTPRSKLLLSIEPK